MSRPQSMPDFTALMENSKTVFQESSSSHMEKRIHSRRQTSPERRPAVPWKKPNLSLAAGLMMNHTETPMATGPLSPHKRSHSRPATTPKVEPEEGGNLFYAYALRSDYPSSPPYILTFASADVCSTWWAIISRKYTASSRASPQFFVVRSEDMELIQDDPELFEIRNKWFYTSQDSPKSPPIVIPLQHANGVPAAAPSEPPEDKATTSALDSLAESLTRLTSVVESNAEQVHALSIAQSAGLQAMQEINESSCTQIRAISNSQLKLQALVDQNASHYIALSNTSFQSQEQTRHSQEATRKTQEQTQKSQDQTRDILKTTVSQLQTLSKNHLQLSQNVEGMMRSIESLNSSVNQTTMSDTASTHSCSANSSNALVPAPRKLNRRVKGIWYEYDHLPTQHAHTTTTRRRVDSTLDTPPKSPVVFKHV